MTRVQKVLQKLGRTPLPQFQPFQGPTERYLAAGDETALRFFSSPQVRADQWAQHWLTFFTASLAPLKQFQEEDRRILRLLAAANAVSHELARWVGQLRQSELGDEAFTAAIVELRAAGFSPEQVDMLAALCASDCCDKQGNPSAIGKMLLQMDDDRLFKAVESSIQNRRGYWLIGGDRISAIMRLFVHHAPSRGARVLAECRVRLGDPGYARALADNFGARFESVIEEIYRDNPDELALIIRLAANNPGRFMTDFELAFARQLSRNSYLDLRSIGEHLGAKAINPMIALLRREDDKVAPAIAERYVDYLQKYGGDRAADALWMVVESAAHPAVRAMALEHLVSRKDPAMQARLEAAIEKGMEEDARDAARFAALATHLAGDRLRERLWADLGAKSKLRREAAALALAGGGADASRRAAGLLTSASKDIRHGAVLLLARLKDPSAQESLLNWLGREESEEIRDEISRALAAAGVGLEAIVSSLGPVDLAKLSEQAASVREMPVKWLSSTELPALQAVDGQTLEPALVRLLLLRQSRQKEPMIDPQAAGIYGLIDRRCSGNFALALLNAALEAGPAKNDAWALLTAGLLGDNRVITTLLAKIRGWAQSGDQKLGEWGVAALALNGSDAALSAIDSLAMRFRDDARKKFRVIADAAQAALESTARRLRISADELGDRIVPSLGFEPGRPRRIEAGNRVIEAAVGLDFKLSMKDAKTAKRVVSIPKTAGLDVSAEFKGLGKLLLEVGKAQGMRLENLMVGQHRWTALRWRELFLQHPVLFPFAVRLVWGAYSAGGKPSLTFRALPDRSLTNFEDETVDLPADQTPIGIVHPLDLTPEETLSWRTHLSDYEIEPPFAQIDRPVVRVSPAAGASTRYSNLEGVGINALALRSKAERFGWTRSGDFEGGMINSFRKRFSRAGIEAFVTVNGVPVFTDPSAQATFGEILFLPIDTTPRDFNERVIKLADVPEMVFSEAVGDMLRISGKTDAAAPP